MTRHPDNVHATACAWLKAAARLETGSSLWAASCAHGFDAIKTLIARGVMPPKPTWFNDVDLLDISARAVSAAPQDVHTLLMRARVLSHSTDRVLNAPQMWEPRYRSVCQVREAAVMYRKAACSQTLSHAERHQFEEAALCCSKWADDHDPLRLAPEEETPWWPAIRIQKEQEAAATKLQAAQRRAAAKKASQRDEGGQKAAYAGTAHATSAPFRACSE